LGQADGTGEVKEGGGKRTGEQRARLKKEFTWQKEYAVWCNKVA
jgi:hypothetical protein